MSTWTSDPVRAALLGAALLLGGCGGGLGPWGGSDGDSADREVAVTSDAVTITGPQGYCVDPTATRNRSETAFVLMGNCAVISNARSAGQPAVNAVLTASVSEADPGRSLRESIPELDDFFRSDTGRELLSRSGDAETVQILDSFHQGDVFYLRARDASAGDIQDVSAEYWRAYMDLGARIVTLSVLGIEGQPLSSEQGLATLRQFTGAVAAANVAAPAPEVVTPMSAPVPSDAPGTLWNIGLFRRILS